MHPNPDPTTRAQFAAQYFRDKNGQPWTPRPYQLNSLHSDAPRKIHCDGRDVGKTTEIEIIACWAMMNLPNTSMLIATQTQNHLDPILHRLARHFRETPQFATRLIEARRTPSWYFRFDNGFELWGRLAGPRGINFQGMHVDWQIIDEAQELTEAAWGEILQALNANGKRWVYGVPNGIRNTYHRLTHDTTAEQHHWPSHLNPDYTPEKDAELQRLYGGADSPGYRHRVHGEHAEPTQAVFNIEDYQACINPDLPHIDEQHDPQSR